MLIAKFPFGCKPVFKVPAVFAAALNVQFVSAKLNLISCRYVLMKVNHDYCPR